MIIIIYLWFWLQCNCDNEVQKVQDNHIGLNHLSILQDVKLEQIEPSDDVGFLTDISQYSN